MSQDIPFQGFIGPSYQLTNKYAAVERTVNWLLTVNEQTGALSFDPTPANTPYSVLPVPAPFNQPCRGLVELNGQVFGVNGNQCYQLKSDGTYVSLGIVAQDSNPAQLISNGANQVLVISGTKGYIIPVGTPPGSLIALEDTVTAGGFLGASYATFQDGYFLTIIPNSRQMQISGTDQVPLGDGTYWDAGNISDQAGQADYLSAIISSREYVRILGLRRSQVYYDIGQNGIGTFPFQSYNETFIETGIAAPFSLVSVSDSLIWVGQDKDGLRSCWRDGAFNPQRVSTFAVEQFWQKYAKVSDAIAFTYVWNGHLLYQITFPSAYIANPASGFPLGNPPGYIGATWVYDLTVSSILKKPIWFERSHRNSRNMAVQRSEAFHCYVGTTHLVGSTGIDGNPGAIYAYSDSVFTDCGDDGNGNQVQRAVVPRRTCPHIASGRNRIVINRLRLNVKQAVGTDGTTDINPYIYMRTSKDGGNTYGIERISALGAEGQYQQMTYWNKLGYSRDWVIDVYGGDPCYYGIDSAFLAEFECAS